MQVRSTELPNQRTQTKQNYSCRPAGGGGNDGGDDGGGGGGDGGDDDND